MFEGMVRQTTKLLTKKVVKSKAKQPESENKHAFIDIMNEEEIHQLLTSLLPIVKLEPGKYMIGTEKKPIQIKSDRLYIRVGGGYMSLEDYIKQNGPFECIKLNKVMRDKNFSFKEAVKFYLDKHKASKKVVSDWLKAEDSNAELFEKAIAKMREQQDAKNQQFTKEQLARRAAA